jgi:ATP-dependent Clp protease ATP-binding subunit ClpA
MFERLDPAAAKVLEAAFSEAAALDDDAISTEHLLLALANTDTATATARLVAEAGAHSADIRRVLAATRGHRPNRHRDHETLLATLGIDVTEVRRRAEETFGTDAVVRAAQQARPRRPHRPLWSRFSCSKPLPRRPPCDSPLAGQPLRPIPRVKRLLERATGAARPHLASSSHLLLALITGNEPACEILTAFGVDLAPLAAAITQQIEEHGAAGKRASERPWSGGVGPRGG